MENGTYWDDLGPFGNLYGAVTISGVLCNCYLYIDNPLLTNITISDFSFIWGTSFIMESKIFILFYSLDLPSLQYFHSSQYVCLPTKEFILSGKDS